MTSPLEEKEKKRGESLFLAGEKAKGSERLKKNKDLGETRANSPEKYSRRVGEPRPYLKVIY